MDSKDRFKDNPNGVITDSENSLGWLPKDSYLDLGAWMNWQEAEEKYLATMRMVYAGGFNDWRLPTKEEALSLILEDEVCLDFEGETLHIHSVFVPKGGSWIWTSDVNDQGQALRINLRDGSEEYVDKTTRDHMAVRGVRSQ